MGIVVFCCVVLWIESKKKKNSHAYKRIKFAYFQTSTHDGVKDILQAVDGESVVDGQVAKSV